MDTSCNLKIDTEEILKELDEIYGIEECKWEIVNYIKYMDISKENRFANFNIIIHNESNYPIETKDKLVDYIYRKLKEKNIVKTNYEYLNSRQLRKFEIDDDKYDSEDKESFNLKNDLIIIDSEKVGRRLESWREEIISIMEKFKEKIFIIIDDNFMPGLTNASFNQYFDWYFEISRISKENKQNYVEKVLEKNNIKIEEDCDYISNLVDESFYIVRSRVTHILLECKINNIDKITDEVAKKYFKNINNKENNISSRRKKDDKKDSNKELKMESLIGIKDIKKEIDKIVNYVKICKERKSKLPSLHMCFTGNPGTGKTTVARIMGQIFKEEKILSKGEFVEIHGRDLVGQYVGWTAKEVQRHVRRAKGGILFIDEAYSLNSDTRGSFEDEAIATLIKEMEDNRDDLCVILAGYKDEMKELIERNPGFESRIQFYIDFPDYSESELYEIFKNLVKKENYKLSSQIKDYLEEYFAKSKKSSTFANGRFVRNLYEKVKIEQANRVSGNSNQDINLIKKCDIENVLDKIQVKQEVKRKIGF